MVKFKEIEDINDDLLLPWLDLYEISFPPEQKLLVSVLLSILKSKAKGESRNIHMLAALDDSDELVGLMLFQLHADSRLAHLWYLAVHPNSRGSGIGSICHSEVLRQAGESGMRAALMEVEIPEELQDSESSQLAARRIEFYRRHGAFLLQGIRYIHSVGSHQPQIPMHIMIHPFTSVTAAEAFEMARIILNDSISQVGELRL